MRRSWGIKVAATAEKGRRKCASKLEFERTGYLAYYKVQNTLIVCLVSMIWAESFLVWRALNHLVYPLGPIITRNINSDRTAVLRSRKGRGNLGRETRKKGKE